MTLQAPRSSAWTWACAIPAFVLSAIALYFLVQTRHALGHASAAVESRVGIAPLLEFAGVAACPALILGALAWRPRGALLSRLALGVPTVVYVIIGVGIPCIGAEAFCAPNEGAFFSSITPERQLALDAGCRHALIPEYLVPLALAAAIVLWRSRHVLRARLTSPSGTPATPS